MTTTKTKQLQQHQQQQQQQHQQQQQWWGIWNTIITLKVIKFNVYLHSTVLLSGIGTTHFRIQIILTSTIFVFILKFLSVVTYICIQWQNNSIGLKAKEDERSPGAARCQRHHVSQRKNHILFRDILKTL